MCFCMTRVIVTFYGLPCGGYCLFICVFASIVQRGKMPAFQVNKKKNRTSSDYFRICPSSLVVFRFVF